MPADPLAKDPSKADANSLIGRWVTFLATPLIALVAGFIALKANAWFDMNLTTAEVTAWVGSLVLAIGTAIGVWLHNRGKYEIASLTGLTPEQVAAAQALIESRLPTAPTSPGSPAPPPPPAPPSPPTGQPPPR